MKIFKWIVYFSLYIVLLIIGVFFVANNSQIIKIDVLGYIIGPLPVWFFIVAGGVIGIITSAIFSIIYIIKLQIKNSKLKDEVNKLNDTLKRERNESVEIIE